VKVHGKKAWDDTEHPNWPSGDISIPLRRLKEFTIDNQELIKYNILEKDDFIKHNLHKKMFRPFPEKRFWVKISYSGKQCCIVDDTHMLDKINSNPLKTIYVNKLIKRDEKTMINIGKFKEVTFGFDKLIPYIEEKLKIKITREKK